MISLSSCILENDEDSPPSKSYISAKKFIITSVSSNAIHLQWSKAYIQYSGGVPSYYSTIAPKTYTVERANSNGLFYKLSVLPGDSISYVDNTLDTTITYFYRIASEFSNDSTIYSDTAAVKFGSTFSVINTLQAGSIAELSHDGNQIVVQKYNGVVEFRDINSGTSIKEMDCYRSKNSWSTNFTLSPSGKYIAAFGNYYDTVSQLLQGEVNILQISDGTLIKSIHNQERISCGVFGLTDDEIITGGFKPSLSFLNILGNTTTKQLNPDSIYAFNLAIDRSHSVLAVASSSNNIIRLISVKTGEIFRNLSGHNDRTYIITFSRDGKYLITDAINNKIAFWNVADGTLLKMLGSSSNYLSSLCFSQDNSLIFSGYDDGRIRVWNSSTGKLFRTLTQHKQSVSTILLSPDGTKLFTCGSDKIVIWSLLQSSGGEWYLEE